MINAKIIPVKASIGFSLKANVGASLGGSGVSDHEKLKNRDKPDQHPIEAISGLKTEISSIKASVKKKQDSLIGVPASVGQVAVISRVDSKGKPTEWKPEYPVQIATNDDILDLLAEMVGIEFATAPDGSIYTDGQDNVLLV